MLKQKKGPPKTVVMNLKRNGWKICLYAAARKVSLTRTGGQTMKNSPWGKVPNSIICHLMTQFHLS